MLPKPSPLDPRLLTLSPKPYPLNPIFYPNWDELVRTFPGCSFFHSVAWSKVLSESYRYTPAFFVSNKGNNQAVIPIMDVKSALTGRRGVSLPFTDYCEPLVAGDIKFQDILDQIIQYGKRVNWEFIEFRGGEQFLPGALSSSRFFGHRLDISLENDKIFSAFKDAFKRNIKKAYAQGVSVQFFETKEAVKEFYRLNCITRKRHGLPPQPYLFFRKIYEHIISKDQGVVALASHDNKFIAGAVFFHFDGKALYKYGASDITYQNLRPNNLVMWESVRWYREKGFKSLCLGRTEIENHGLRQFKLALGAEEYTIKYYRYNLKSGSFVTEPEKVSAFQTKMLSKLPVFMLKIIGKIYYRHAG
ncbi:MAG: GNAT family N-acetyltransferase [Proteobacteria bacterium]|nr:GNAT family N-acetyltransferase [Pseudomonadota bacterium]